MASKTIYLDDSTLELGEKLAGEDVRSFSNLMAFLIQQEWLRRQRAAEISKPILMMRNGLITQNEAREMMLKDTEG